MRRLQILIIRCNLKISKTRFKVTAEAGTRSERCENILAVVSLRLQGSRVYGAGGEKC